MTATEEAKPERNIVYVVNLPSNYASLYEKAKEICAAHKGGVQLYFFSGGKYYLHDKTVADSEGFVAEMYGLVGPENFIIKERKR